MRYTVYVRLATIVCVFVLIVFGIFFGFRPSTDNIASQVKSEFQIKLFYDKDFVQYGASVASVRVSHRTGSEYTGLATVAYRGVEHDVPIDIVSDRGHFSWRERPGSLDFLHTAK